MALPEKTSEEIEKEMENCRIITLADIYRALKNHPEWAEELRRVLLTEELLNLPKKFDEFVEKEFKPLKIDVETLKREVEALKKEVEALKNDVAYLKGEVLELKVRSNIGAFIGKLIAKAKVIDGGELADQLYEAVEKNLITEEEADYALKVDVLAQGYLRKDSKKNVLIAVEVSYVIDKKDVERVFKRAEIISRAYQKECIPMVLGKRATKGALKRAEEIPVLLI
ncbi:MAG: hypothetical protein ACP5HI_02820 [Caldimicrobium sp.]|jgi:polyhydroxyalkanoate synthesis regulator phasin